MPFTVTLNDGCHLPMIGFRVKEEHDEWEEQLDWVLHHSDRYFEVPLAGCLTEEAMKKIGNHARKTKLTRKDFIISTSIIVPEDVGGSVTMVKEFVAHFGTHIDLLYLENPVGLKGTDPMAIYSTSPDGTHPKIRKLSHMFRRRAEGQLRVTPRITENLWKLWRVLEDELVATGKVHSLGLRYFSKEQVDALLKARVKHRPLALQAEVNPYCSQTDLRDWCQEANIPLVGIHPYGNPHHIPSKEMPFLWENSKVIMTAERVGVGPKVILSRHILQSRLRMVYDNTELLLPHFMIENIWRFSLTPGQMNKLGRLSKLPLKNPVSKYGLMCVIDPWWPYCFVKEEKEYRKEGKETKVGRKKVVKIGIRKEKVADEFKKKWKEKKVKEKEASEDRRKDENGRKKKKKKRVKKVQARKEEEKEAIELKQKEEETEEVEVEMEVIGIKKEKEEEPSVIMKKDDDEEEKEEASRVKKEVTEEEEEEEAAKVKKEVSEEEEEEEEEEAAQFKKEVIEKEEEEEYFRKVEKKWEEEQEEEEIIIEDEKETIEEREEAYLYEEEENEEYAKEEEDKGEESEMYERLEDEAVVDEEEEEEEELNEEIEEEDGEVNKEEELIEILKVEEEEEEEVGEENIEEEEEVEEVDESEGVELVEENIVKYEEEIKEVVKEEEEEKDDEEEEEEEKKKEEEEYREVNEEEEKEEREDEEDEEVECIEEEAEKEDGEGREEEEGEEEEEEDGRVVFNDEEEQEEEEWTRQDDNGDDDEGE
ncbi:golgin subfamily A member 6-like protein 22 [Eriocheir sinensis]|uniref:golgin subfamily A member 6-like protein 22 n=1 Tax=Eriocheir sinensis TaxID=95602 RepID=UPI0021CA0326|nr:golgin subfamily A member 6-like protein 22 [Eriocheir sinensis]XP_050711872.1 golgin subfamily A member 6-like protein 22 [Eriocheir sinensis]XP_050711873.1 golgin subfamily A member 6-like protein 22 [Eriocheir sinensis]XP_050711874.1 golgin subfamily A member 6-like protein 22 [Eriocheir sinensis]XP_050711875.1 golgin subfamily A member 6-like protein 22 [Eriocheir sinensis]